MALSKPDCPLPASTFCDRGLGQLLVERLACHPASVALRIPDGLSWTWAQLGAQAGAIQRGLDALGLKAGGHVALMADNSARMAALLCAITGFGAVVIPVNTALVGEGLAHVLNDSDARVLIADAAYLERCQQLDGLRPGALQHRISTGESGAGDPWSRHFAQEGRLIARGKGADAALILYTSGTTGRSKGVIISHACALMAIEASASVMFEARQSDVLYTCLPLFHCAAQRLGFWTSLRSGAALVLGASFSASGFWDQMRFFGVTKFHFIGPMLSILWKAPPGPRDRDHPARRAVGGGPRLAYRPFEERFGLTAVESYGMTETFGGCVSHRAGEGKAGTVGRALDHVEIAVMDEAGMRLPPGMEGEVCIRPRYQDALFSAYYKRPDLTQSAMRDGWFRSGDLGTLDAEGYLTYRSRLKDIIRRRGENISPTEVEEAICRFPGVSECAVVGVAAEIGDDEVLAVVVPSGDALDIERLVVYLSKQIAAFALPRFVALAPALPKTSTSRVQRHELKTFMAQTVDTRPFLQRKS